MNLLEDIFGGLLSAIFEIILLGTLRLIGAAAKWTWYGGKKPWQTIFAEGWNGRLGLLIVVIVVALIIGGTHP
jgi:hypothetical protein